MQLDAQGNILFFVVDHSVYNKDGERIGDLYTSASPVGTYYMRGNAEIVIVPDPANCQRYYIVASADDGAASLNNRIPHFALLDMSLTNGNGIKGKLLDVNNDGKTIKSIASITPDYFTGNPYEDVKMGGVSIAATKLRSDNSRFVFLTNGRKVFRYKINSSGFNYSGSFSLSSNNSVFNTLNIRSEMELVSLPGGNYRIAVPFAYEPSTNNKNVAVFTADLDGNGNLISGSTNQLNFTFSTNDTYHPFIHGLEFSPNGNILYITHDNSYLHPNPIEYYDFSNPSAGVQPLSVSNAIDFKSSQIEMGIDNKLYFATSNRLATLSNPNTPSTSNWQNNALTINNTPNYGGGTTSEYYLKLYSLPDQIDGMDYEAHFFANSSCCIANQWYSAESYSVRTNATWQPGSNPFGNTTGTVYIKNTLTIPAGKNITIKNMVFKFGPNAKVIVSRGNALYAGGKLNLDGTVFSADTRCDASTMWLGVEVYGDPTKAQLPEASSKQGWFQMNNNSVIEHTLNGVTAAKMNYSFFSYYPDNNYTGGVIRATNSKFKNSVKDVQIFNYKPPQGSGNASNFTRCEFFTDGLLNAQSYLLSAHVYLENVEGISFTGCQFENRTPSLFPVGNRGIGINTNNANYNVNAYCLSGGINCTNYAYSSFKNLRYGVYSVAGGGVRTFKIDRANFINTMFGVRSQGINLAEIVRSNFELLRTKAPNTTEANYGIYLDGCDQYKIEGNMFTEFNDPHVSGHGNTTGIVVSNSGANHNEIYRNQFHDLDIGVRASGNNGQNYLYGDPNPSNNGLQIKCNHFYNNMYSADIAVTTGRIDYHQGYCLPANNSNAQKNLAGNRFSHSTFTSQNDIAVNSGVLAFNYAHHADYITTPIYKSSLVSTQSCNGIIFNESQACPSTLSGLIVLPPFGFRHQLDSLQQLIIEKERQLQTEVLSSTENRIDNSNTVIESPLFYQKKVLEAERNNLINKQLRAIIFDTTIVNKEEHINELLELQKEMFQKFSIPTYLKNLPDSISPELDYYFAAALDSLPLAIIEPLIEDGRVTVLLNKEEVSYFSIYPNPTTVTLNTTIELQNVSNEDATNYSVEIYDLSMYGQQWISQKFTVNKTSLEIPNNVLKTGFYVVKLFQNDQLIEMKTLRVD